MGSLIAIVSFIACVSGFGGMLWFATKRGQSRDDANSNKGVPPMPSRSQAESQPSEPDNSRSILSHAPSSATSEQPANEQLAEIPESAIEPSANTDLPISVAPSVERPDAPVEFEHPLPVQETSVPATFGANPQTLNAEFIDLEALKAEFSIQSPRSSTISNTFLSNPLSVKTRTLSSNNLSNDLDGLQDEIAEWGETGKVAQLNQLSRYINHIDPDIRTAVASAIGAIASQNRGQGLEPIIPHLGKLSRDSKPDVSVVAVEALGQIRSNNVLPWLQQALKHPNPDVIKAASTAIQTLKFDYGKKPQKAIKPLQPNGQKKR